jgi:kumamolisin
MPWPSSGNGWTAITGKRQGRFSRKKKVKSCNSKRPGTIRLTWLGFLGYTKTVNSHFSKVIASNPCSRKFRGLCVAALVAFALTIVSAASASTTITGAPIFSGIKASFPGSITTVASDPLVHMVRQTLTPSEQNATLQFSVVLKMPNFDELEARIANGEQIAPDEMAARYLPSAADYATVEAWLKGQGLTVVTEDPNYRDISVSGTIARIQNSLGVNFARVTTADGQFTSAINAPSLPIEFSGAVLTVTGLQPHLRMHHFGTVVHPFGTTSFFYPGDILTAYNAPSTFDGTGQTIAIIMDSTVTKSDLTTFYTTVGSKQTVANVTIVPVDGGNPAPTDTEGEATLDVEWSSAIAPGAKVRLYNIPDLSFTHLHDACVKILADAAANNITVVSFSAGAPELADSITATSVAANITDFSLLSAAGISVFVASGDGGSNPDSSGAGNGYVKGDLLEVNYPASDVNVTGVGGTELSLTNFSTYQSEAVFSDISGNTGSASGGGVSAVFTKPIWQVDGVTGSILTTNSKRCVPDVSVVWGADQSSNSLAALIVLNGADEGIGGTSLSSPIWAGVAAITNQARASVGGSTLGLLGPAIYPLAISTPSVLYDVTSGNNGAYDAIAGYDLCTGLGSPDIANFIAPLSAVFPTITQQPKSVTVNVGSSINLLVQATSSAVSNNTSNLTYLWLKNGVSTGVTTQYYAVFAVTKADAGAYTVNVTDSLGTEKSATATVTVNTPAPPSSGGGGALSYEFYLALGMLLVIRKVLRAHPDDEPLIKRA